jgi:hypothetical protein
LLQRTLAQFTISLAIGLHMQDGNYPTREYGLGRTLKQAAEIEPLNVTTVSTPEGLRDAVQNGALDIVITEHLDLTTLQLLKTSICPVGCDSPLGEIATTRSIRVRAPLHCDAIQSTSALSCGWLWVHTSVSSCVWSPRFKVKV